MNCDMSAPTSLISAKNNVDINVPVNVVTKAFIKAKITADDGSANSSDSEAILTHFSSDMEESDFSASEDYVTVGFAAIVVFKF